MTTETQHKPPRHQGGGWVDLDPGGKLEACRWCKGPIPNGRRTFCSNACVNEHLCRASAAGAAKVVGKRDHGVCAKCGLDCEALSAELRMLRRRDYDTWMARLRELGLTKKTAWGEVPLNRKRLWDVDHVVSVAEGGGSCGPEGLRTLCWACHRTETAALRKRLAANGPRKNPYQQILQDPYQGLTWDATEPEERRSAFFDRFAKAQP